jgi:hypothetical protein
LATGCEGDGVGLGQGDDVGTRRRERNGGVREREEIVERFLFLA